LLLQKSLRSIPDDNLDYTPPGALPSGHLMSGDGYYYYYYYWSAEHGRRRCGPPSRNAAERPILFTLLPYHALHRRSTATLVASLVNYNNHFRFHTIGQRYPVTDGAEAFNLKFTVGKGNKNGSKQRRFLTLDVIISKVGFPLVYCMTTPR